MKISILQWNVWCDEDIRNCLKFIKEHRTDIICLQELTINYPKQVIKDAPNFIATELGYNAHWQELPIESVSGGKLMLANGVFTKFPINQKRIYWSSNPQGSEGHSNEKRVYIEVELRVDNKKLSVGTTHMSYTHRFEITDQKKEETKRLIKYIAKHKSKYVITGDMNASPGSYTIKKLESILKNIGPDYNQNTWTTKPFSYNGFEENDLNWRLDHMFATPDVKLISSEVLETQYSDHLPILSIVEI